MSDRTWNAIDGALYEEDWTQSAKLIAGVMLARCPNQYGVFKMPFWFLRMIFEGIYTRHDIDAAIVEWEGDGWIKYYPKTETVWICNKWGRCEQKPGENNIKGAINHLKRFPEVLDGFKARYTELEPCLTPVPPPSDTPSTPDPEPDPDPDPEPDPEHPKKKQSPKSGDEKKSISKRRIITDAYQDCHVKKFGKKPTWGSPEGKRVGELLKRFEDDAERIATAIRNAFASDDDFMQSVVSSFMTLTAAACISKADTLTAQVDSNQHLPKYVDHEAHEREIKEVNERIVREKREADEQRQLKNTTA